MKVTTIEACERLLCEGIRGHYLGHDALAVHVVLSSAYNLARDLVRHDRPEHDHMELILTSDKQLRKKFWDAFRALYVFLHHAGKGSIREFDVVDLNTQNSWLLKLAAYEYYVAQGPSNILWSIVFAHFIMERIELIKMEDLPPEMREGLLRVSAFEPQDIPRLVRDVVLDVSFREQVAKAMGQRYV